MSNLNVPEEAEEWPFDARLVAISGSNETKDLRKEVDALVGMESEEYDNKPAGQFTKQELAHIILALGGPQ